MSKAEERAYEAYPFRKETNGIGWYDGNVTPRTIYREGYEQAEKDLALNWDDIAIINQLHFEVMSEVNPEEFLPHEVHQEVLRRFNEQRNKQKEIEL